MVSSAGRPFVSRYLVVLLVLGAIWGSSYLFIKVAVRELPPETVVSGRVLLGALVLLAVLYARGQRLPGGLRVWRDFLVVGIGAVALPFTLISWGEKSISSGMAAILTGATPLFAVLGAAFWTREERLSRSRLVGVGLGFAGVVLAVGLKDFSITSENSRGQMAVLAAAVCYGLSGLYARRAFRGMPPLIPAAGQLVAGSLVIVPVALIRHGIPGEPSLKVTGAMLALALMCTALAYILLYWLMERIGAVRTVMVTYLMPPFALLYGWVLLDERLGANAILGLLVVLLGILITNGVLRWPALHRPEPAATSEQPAASK